MPMNQGDWHLCRLYKEAGVSISNSNGTCPYLPGEGAGPMVFAASLILYCMIASLGAVVCLMSWREGAVAKAKTYRPERYFMRGPGPKWREKHARAPMSGIR